MGAKINNSGVCLGSSQETSVNLEINADIPPRLGRPKAKRGNRNKPRAWCYSLLFHLITVTVALMSFPLISPNFDERYTPPIEIVEVPLKESAPPTPVDAPDIPLADLQQAVVEIVEFEAPEVEEVTLDVNDADDVEYKPVESLILTNPDPHLVAQRLARKPAHKPASAVQPLRKPASSSMKNVGLNSRAILLTRLHVDYPDSQRRLGRDESLKMRVYLSSSGEVIRAEPLTRDIHKVFITAAQKALSAARFKPAERDGQPVPTSLLINFHFQLR